MTRFAWQTKHVFFVWFAGILLGAEATDGVLSVLDGESWLLEGLGIAVALSIAVLPVLHASKLAKGEESGT